jgi:hemerythrin-like domain-containing protein
MEPAELRKTIIAEHEVLRGMLLRIEVLAHRVLKGRPGVAEQLRAQARTFDDRFHRHLENEERLLIPVLLKTDAWGAERVLRIREDHASHRRIMNNVLSRHLRGEGNVLEFALVAWGFVRLIREDMDSEEKISLAESALRR